MKQFLLIVAAGVAAGLIHDWIRRANARDNVTRIK